MISQKPYNRSERVEKQILDIISSIAVRKIDLSSLGFVTFTKVDISPDLKNAKIYYSVLNQNLPDADLEIALNKKWIDNKILIESIKFYGNCDYSRYLKNLLQ